MTNATPIPRMPYSAVRRIRFSMFPGPKKFSGTFKERKTQINTRMIEMPTILIRPARFSFMDRCILLFCFAWGVGCYATFAGAKGDYVPVARAMIDSSSNCSRLSSPEILPSCITRIRSEIPITSSSSLETTKIPIPSATSCSINW